MQKARGQAASRGMRPPTARRHGVSGSVSSPRRGSSHRSVALLASLSVAIESLALRDGPRRFGPGSTCPTLLGYRSGACATLAYGTLTRSGAVFQAASAGLQAPHVIGPTTPPGDPGGLGWSPFARRYWGSRGCFLLLRVLRCFSSPGLVRVSRDRRAFGRSPALLAACHARKR